MSDQEIQLNPQPEPPGITAEPTAPRPTKLRPFAIASGVLGALLLVAAIVGIMPGGPGTGVAFLLWGILMFALSFVRLPQVVTDEQPMTAIQKLTGIFFEPSRVFRNLRSHPYWLAPFLVIAILSIIYANAFVQRKGAENIVSHTMDKLAESPIKPPPDRMEQAREDALQQLKQPIQRVQSAGKSFIGLFFLGAFVAALYLVAIMVFGGRINFWQAFAVFFYATLPVVVIMKIISLVILFLKDPEDIHPILGQETLVQDNLGVLFNPAEHPVLFVLAASIGVLSFYGLWLRAKGLQNGGTKVGSTAAWGAALIVWVLGVLLVMTFTAIFPSFIS